MRLQIGHKVAVLDDVLSGKIVSISDNEITIEDKDGMHFNFIEKELVLIDENQHDLSRFSDIDNQFLAQKK